MSRNLNNVELEKIVSLAKRRGIIFQSSEIYGGLSSVWDYGPVGVELKRNVKDQWWKSMVRDRDDVVGIDASILMHPNVWVASGHLDKLFTNQPCSINQYMNFVNKVIREEDQNQFHMFFLQRILITISTSSFSTGSENFP